jgi:hypothetical protein
VSSFDTGGEYIVELLSILSGSRPSLLIDEPIEDTGSRYGDLRMQAHEPATPPPDRVAPAAEAGYALEPAPIGATAAAAVPSLSRQAVLARIGLVGIAAAALLASLIVIFGSGAAPTGILAAGTSDSTANGSSSGSVEQLNRGFPGGGPFAGGRAGFGGGITITAISGNSISLATDDGWARTITVDSGTTYEKGDATIALADLKVGDEVLFRETHEADGSWTIDAIHVVLPRAGGQVTKISGSTITLQDRDGTTSTVTVDGQTTFTVNGASAKLADVKVGMFLVAEGTRNGDGSLTATVVRAGDRGAFMGRGGRGGHGPGSPDQDGDQPNASAAPGATSGTGSAS